MLIQQYVKFGKKYGPMMMDLWNNPQDKDKIIELIRIQSFLQYAKFYCLF